MKYFKKKESMYRKQSAYIEEPLDEDDYIEDTMYEDVEAPTSLLLDDEGHLKREQVWGLQSRIFDIDLVASLEELEGNGGKQAVWSIADHQLKNLKQNMAMTDRDMPSKEDLAGNLNRGIPLHMEILEQKSDFPVKMGININGIVPQTMTSDGTFVWTVAANTPTQAVNQPVFEPKNVFTKHMYKKWKVLSSESLDKEMRFDPESGFCYMSPSGIAFEVLCDNLAQGYWEEYDHTQLPIAQIINAGEMGRGPPVPIPIPIAEEIKKTLSPHVEQISKSFMDLNKFQVRWTRADGEHFNSFRNLVGEVVGSETDPMGTLRDDKLNTRYCASIKVKLEYLVF
jgi:hypothetical protein